MAKKLARLAARLQKTRNLCTPLASKALHPTFAPTLKSPPTATAETNTCSLSRRRATRQTPEINTILSRPEFTARLTHLCLPFKMKLPQALAVVSLFTVSYACLKFVGKYNWDTRFITGYITDNDRMTCIFRGKFQEPQHFGSCVSGFSAFIDQSFTWASYSNHGNEGNVGLRKETGPGLNNHEFFLLGLSYFVKHKCSYFADLSLTSFIFSLVCHRKVRTQLAPKKELLAALAPTIWQLQNGGLGLALEFLAFMG
ncbi:hypothetical protein V496_10541 [Pseudogymnoascus sp. VKM F-4515 (FW-2607)]|nr:hypothetical protein V496_10541 [Pseudogymnoascus sp. VKM F-4515 (FW-2607)]